MRFRTIASCLVVLLWATVAAAQPTKISGTAQCSKPEAQHAIPVGDQPNHLYGVSKVACTWTKPLMIAGTPTKDGTNAGFDDIAGAIAKGHGLHVSKLASGDEFHVRYQGSSSLKENTVQTAEGTWMFIAGTGKVAGIKGKGTYKGKANPDGTFTYDVEGEYELPKKP